MIRPALSRATARARHVRAGAVACVAALAAAAALPPRAYVLDRESRFWIEGSSTMGPYTCRARQIAGSAAVASDEPLAGRAELRAEVRSFDCGQREMNRDFARALKAAQHPTVQLVVERVTVGPLRGGASTATASGRLRLAGVERPVTFTATGRPMGNGRVRIEGQHALRMTDFGVTPPSGLMGLVRAHDRVVARFDVVVRP